MEASASAMPHPVMPALSFSSAGFVRAPTMRELYIKQLCHPKLRLLEEQYYTIVYYTDYTILKNDVVYDAITYTILEAQKVANFAFAGTHLRDSMHGSRARAQRPCDCHGQHLV